MGGGTSRRAGAAAPADRPVRKNKTECSQRGYQYWAEWPAGRQGCSVCRPTCAYANKTFTHLLLIKRVLTRQLNPDPAHPGPRRGRQLQQLAVTSPFEPLANLGGGLFDLYVKGRQGVGTRARLAQGQGRDEGRVGTDQGRVGVCTVLAQNKGRVGTRAASGQWQGRDQCRVGFYTESQLWTCSCHDQQPCAACKSLIPIEWLTNACRRLSRRLYPPRKHLHVTGTILCNSPQFAPM